jgi:hypothetical protein
MRRSSHLAESPQPSIRDTARPPLGAQHFALVHDGVPRAPALIRFVRQPALGDREAVLLTHPGKHIEDLLHDRALEGRADLLGEGLPGADAGQAHCLRRSG